MPEDLMGNETFTAPADQPGESDAEARPFGAPQQHSSDHNKARPPLQQPWHEDCIGRLGMLPVSILSELIQRLCNGEPVDSVTHWLMNQPGGSVQSLMELALREHIIALSTRVQERFRTNQPNIESEILKQMPGHVRRVYQTATSQPENSRREVNQLIDKNLKVMETRRLLTHIAEFINERLEAWRAIENTNRVPCVEAFPLITELTAVTELQRKLELQEFVMRAYCSGKPIPAGVVRALMSGNLGTESMAKKSKKQAAADPNKTAS